MEEKHTVMTQTNMYAINAHILQNAIKKGVTGREDVEFSPLFYFVYADGHKMLTLGGMIGNPVDRRFLEASDFSKAPYIRRNIDESPYEIIVPILTRKERLCLDSQMPCADGWKPMHCELDEDWVRIYREIYRFFPTYAEILI